MDVLRRRKKTTLMEFFRTGKRYRDITDKEEKELKQKETATWGKFKNKIPMPKVTPIKKTPDEINTYWKLVILYNSGVVGELKTIKPDTENFCGKDGFNPFLEWFMCSMNPYYLFNYSTGLKIYIRKEITEISVKKYTTEENTRRAYG